MRITWKMSQAHRPLSPSHRLWGALVLLLALASPLAPGEDYPGSLLPSFNLNLSQPAQVRLTVPTPEGNLLILGDFETVNGESRPGFARLLADGELDPDFLPAIHIGDVPGRSFHVVPLANGRIFLTAEGWPQELNKAPTAEHAHAVLHADGSLAASPFLDSLSPHDLIYPVYTAGDRLFLRITSAEGESRLALISTITLRELPFATGDWPEVPFDMIAHESGYWVLGGTARNTGPTLFRITTSGGRDLSFQPRQLPRLAPHQRIQSLVPVEPIQPLNPLLPVPESIQPIASYYLFPTSGSNFLIACEAHSRFLSAPSPKTQKIAVFTYDEDGVELHRTDYRVGTRRPALFHRATDGTVLATDNTSQELGHYDLEGDQIADFAIPLLLHPYRNEPFGTHTPGLALLPLTPNGKIIGKDAQRYLTDGTLDESWRTPQVRKPGTVTKLFPGPNGSVYVSGHFDQVNDFFSPNLVRLMPDGKLDRDFTVDPAITNAFVHDVAVDGSLFVTNGNPSYALHRLQTNGSLDDNFQSSFLTNLSIREAHLEASGTVLLVTEFESTFFLYHNLHRLTAEGNVDENFSHNNDPDEEGIPIHGRSAQRPIYPLPDGSYLASNHHFRADGIHEGPLPATLSAKLADGWNLLGPHPFSLRFSPPILHRWHPEHGLDESFQDPFQHPSTLNSPFPGPTRISMTHGLRDGRILAAGSLYTGASYHFLRLHESGSPDFAFSPPKPHRIIPGSADLELLLDGGNLRPATRTHRTSNADFTTALELTDGTILVGGSFTHLDSKSQTGLAALCGGVASSFESWCTATFARAQAGVHAAGPEHDSDGDGASNLYEYATGTDPLSIDIAPTQLQIDPTSSDTWILPRNPDANVDLHIDISTDLQGWELATVDEVTITEKPNHYRIMLNPTERTRFLRARFSMP